MIVTNRCPSLPAIRCCEQHCLAEILRYLPPIDSNLERQLKGPLLSLDRQLLVHIPNPNFPALTSLCTFQQNPCESLPDFAENCLPPVIDLGITPILDASSEDAAAPFMVAKILLRITPTLHCQQTFQCRFADHVLE